MPWVLPGMLMRASPAAMLRTRGRSQVRFATPLRVETVLRSLPVFTLRS
jgi:hypothetical protein